MFKRTRSMRLSEMLIPLHQRNNGGTFAHVATVCIKPTNQAFKPALSPHISDALRLDTVLSSAAGGSGGPHARFERLRFLVSERARVVRMLNSSSGCLQWRVL